MSMENIMEEKIADNANDKPDTAVILLFLSKYSYNYGEKEDIYMSDQGPIEGAQTNDAPVRYLIKRAVAAGKQKIKVLCLTSKEVYMRKVRNTESDDEKVPLYPSTYNRFMQLVDKECSEQINIETNLITYDFIFGDDKPYDGAFDESDDESAAIIPVPDENIPLNIYNQIMKAVGTDKYEAYIDFTGGLRDTNLMMVSMIRYLEFSNIECLDVVYSDIYGDCKRIKSIKHIYNLFQLVNGLSEFVTTSNAYILENLFGKAKKPELVDAIIKFSRGMSICTVDSVEQNLKEVSRAITNLEAQTEFGGDHVRLYMDMLKSMIPLFKEKMYIDRIVPETGDISYPYLIKWCLNNRLLQQALTLYVEKMPLYYANQGVIKIPSNVDVKSKMGSTVECIYFYEGLFDGHFVTKKKSFQESVRKIIDSNVFSNGTYDQSSIRTLFKTQNLFKEEYNLLSNSIDEIYDCQGNKKSNLKNTTGSSIPNSIDGYFNSLMHGYLPKALADRFSEDYGTYGKKVNALNNIAKTKPEGYDDALIKRMQYYLAVKYIRNNINHAALTEDNNDDEQMLIDYMKENQIFHNDGEVTYDLIWQVLEKGIEIEF